MRNKTILDSQFGRKGSMGGSFAAGAACLLSLLSFLTSLLSLLSFLGSLAGLGAGVSNLIKLEIAPFDTRVYRQIPPMWGKKKRG